MMQCTAVGYILLSLSHVTQNYDQPRIKRTSQILPFRLVEIHVAYKFQDWRSIETSLQQGLRVYLCTSCQYMYCVWQCVVYSRGPLSWPCFWRNVSICVMGVEPIESPHDHIMIVHMYSYCPSPPCLVFALFMLSSSKMKTTYYIVFYDVLKQIYRWSGLSRQR